MRVTIPEDVAVRDLDGEAVLLHLGSGAYFGLDSVATRVWNLLAEHQSTEAVISLLLQEFEVDEERLREDLDALLTQLLTQHLLVPADSST